MIEPLSYHDLILALNKATTVQQRLQIALYESQQRELKAKTNPSKLSKL
jgi:hypothetical protein